MVYQVIARKWRPDKFEDVVGQKHIIQTLQNELLQQKTAHAYLFVGPRGIGKTTIARIFAKALNCEKAPISEPCCECRSCLDIADNNSLDLIEIDGASNNSVNDIRQLREEVLYAPVKSKYKVYIIDEVHMLSTSAWNALLKTIEEPPPHAKFLFATTEAHKVLPTVISRCQRFDLQRISMPEIIQQLQKIAAAENIKVEQEAVEIIARAADGGMRDAQSLLDQMIAFASVDSESITAQQVLAIFGLTGIEELRNLANSIITNNKPELIQSVHKLSLNGKNLEKLLNDVLIYLRGVMICSYVENPEQILETSEEMISIYRESASLARRGLVQKLLESLSPVGRQLHDALNKQVFLETIFLKAMRYAHALDVEELIVRLNAIRQSGDLAVLDKFPSVANNTQIQMPQQTLPVSQSSQFEKKEEVKKNETVQVQQQIPESAPEHIASEQDNNSIPQPEPPKQKKMSEMFKNEAFSDSSGNQKEAIKADTDTSNVFVAEKPKATAVLEDNYTPESLWHLLLKDMETCNQPLLRDYMVEARPVSIENNILTVIFDGDASDFSANEIEKEIRFIETRLKEVGASKNLSLKILRTNEVTSPRTVNHPCVQDLSEVKEKVEVNQFVMDTLDLFDGTIVDVKG